jgi:hypothetical protein
MKEATFEIPNPVAMNKPEIMEMVKTEAVKWLPPGAKIVETKIQMRQIFTATVKFEGGTDGSTEIEMVPPGGIIEL